MTHAPSGQGVAAPAWWTLWLVLVTCAVLAAAHLYARQIVTLLMPALLSALRFFADDFAILRFGFDEDRGNASIAALARLSRTIVLAGRAIVPDGSVMGVSTTIGTVLQPILVASILVLSWPGGGLERVLRLVIAFVLLAGVVLVDTPLSMAAWLWYVQLRVHDPGGTSLLVGWNTFLNGGGRLALGLVAAALAITLARRTVRRMKLRPSCRPAGTQRQQ